MKKRYMLLVAALLATIPLAITYLDFRREIATLKKSLLNGSEVINTELGQIEFLDTGEGPAVLISHGSGGGYDQGAILGNSYAGTGYRIIAPSRFGYLRSSVPEDASAKAQADAYAILLDELRVREVVVLAFSDGGPSALQFCIHYADRCQALMMVSAKSRTPPTETALQRIVFTNIYHSDYLYWLITKYFKGSMLSVFGVSKDAQENLTQAESELIYGYLETNHPISWRKAGIINDRSAHVELPVEQYPLEKIAAPTLVIHAQDDSIQGYEYGEYTAKQIPNSTLLSFEKGGHIIFAGHFTEVQNASTSFLREYTGERN